MPGISIDDPRFHHVFEMPSGSFEHDSTSPFRVAYADYGYRDGNDTAPAPSNVFLFFGPLMASRLVNIAKDDLAKKHKVRIIELDRPGIGGTSPAGPAERMPLWLRVVPALLEHLGISHVSIGCHSGGTVYALDFILHHPQYLHPERPYLAIAAPWILPSHTESILLSVVQSLPRWLIGNTDKFAKLINNYIGPSIGLSVGSAQKLIARVVPSAPSSADAELNEVQTEASIWPKIIDKIYGEGMEGISDEAVLLMQKDKGMNGWGDWGDYDALTPRLAEALRAAQRTLRVETFWPESDFMIGGHGKGAAWFDQCWDEAHCGNTVVYSSTVLKGATHNEAWSLQHATAQTAFRYVGHESPNEDTD